MECKKNKKRRCDPQSGGYADGYGYPVEYYKMGDYGKDRSMPKVEGSFWIACHKKAKGRHSFCDDNWGIVRGAY